MANRLLTILLVLLMLCSSAFLTACDEANEPIVTDTPSSETSEPGVETETDEVTMLPAQDIRVISMNMSYDVENMEERRALMMPLLLSYDPDSIGTQENGGRPLWHEYFKEDMPNYERVGYFSNGLLETDDHYVRDPYTGHYIYYSANYIYYNADKHRCLDWNTIWLSRTPNRLNSYDGCLLRTCCGQYLRTRRPVSATLTLTPISDMNSSL